jgi:hypothetical protein
MNTTQGKIYTESGSYGTGFWHNELVVDLEELAAGNLEKAFRVISDIHDTAGMSFRQYHGLDVHAKLPNGVHAATIQKFCNEIAARAKELTAGFESYWDGSNWRAKWNDVEGADDAAQFWADFRESVSELECADVYDLAFSENLIYVRENISEGRDADFESEAEVLEALHEAYDDAGGYEFINFDEAAADIWQQIQDEKE